MTQKTSLGNYEKALINHFIGAFFVLLSITIKTLKRESKLKRAEGGNNEQIAESG